MLMRSWLVAASVVGGVVGFSFALPDCLVGDDFSSGGLTDIWQVGQSSGSVVSAVESGGQVRFSATANNDMSYDVTYVFSDGWYMDMTSNWAVSGWWYSNPPTPSYGDTGIALGVMLDANPETAYLTYGATVSVGRWGGGGYEDRYEACNTWMNNEYYLLDEVEGYSVTSDTLYVWYDYSFDRLYFSDQLYGGDAFVVDEFQAGSPSNSQQAWIGFGAYSFGQVPGYNSSTYRGDEFCILDGHVVGSNVGACCFGDDSCVETIETSCEGDWWGAGTSCDTACGSDGACCVGTSCQTLTEAECFDAGGSYHGDGVPCASTPCGGGAGCPSGWFEDCAGICFPNDVLDWLGDEYCDDGAERPYEEGEFDHAPPGVYLFFNCEEYLCDEGDCIDESECGPQCWGDVAPDGTVGESDLLALIGAWGTLDPYADIDGDGSVGVFDLLELLVHWGACD